MVIRRVLAIASLIALALADVSFTSPAAGESITGTTFSVEWTDGSDAPALASLTTYDLFICAGGNSDGQFIQLAALKNAGKFTDGDSVTATVQAGIGADVENAYFLKMIANGPGGSVINYSKRFSLPSMTGTFPPQVQAGLKTLTGTDGPPTQNQAAVVNNGAAGDFGVPYLSQTGPTRYAPSAKLPSSKITAKAAPPLYSPFPFSIFLSNQGSPNAQITVTQPQTYSFSSREATMTPAAMPSDSDMAKFLRRWAD